MISLLPPWALTNPHPAFHDSESGSVIEQTAKMYAKVNELVESYNSFTTNITKKMSDFFIADEKAKEEHMTAIRQEFQDFINAIDLKVLQLETDMNSFKTGIDVWKSQQESIIKNAENYMKTNIEETATNLVNQYISEGSLQIGMHYEEDSESLTIVSIPVTSDNSILYTASEEKIDII